jgi:hypothetical protein
MIIGNGQSNKYLFMKYQYGLSDKIIAYLTLISGLVISAVAVWYSVAGLVSIFAASALSIIIMGVALEVSKLVATVWLKWNWKRAPRLIKIYLISAITILMIITSMGIFGYLSKAHLDQNIISGDVQAKIALADEKIKIERENIANAQQVIKQMDAAVNGVIATGDQETKLKDGSTQIRSAAERSLQIRRSQAKDREALTKQIEASQTRIVKLQEESAPIRAEMRKVEAEVGPIKYIAKLIYGDQTDQNMLEKAVTWVIIIIVLVFDPLAVVLLLSSQYSFQWFRQQEEERKDELVQETTPYKDAGKETSPTPESDDGAVDERSGREQPEVEESSTRDDDIEEANRKIAEIEKEDVEPVLPEEPKFNEKDPLAEWNEMIAEAERAVEQEKEKEDHEIIDSASETEKQAMAAWKHDHPDSSLKLQRRLLEKGAIDRLPWEDYLRPKADFSDDEAAEEAAKWALEQVERKKQDQPQPEEITWMEHDEQGNQIIKSKNSYQQNAEQNERTIWQRIQDAKK